MKPDRGKYITFRHSVQKGSGNQLTSHTYLLNPWYRVLLEQLAASQEIPRISRNPKVHYRTHKLPPPVSILRQPNPVHIPTSYLLEIHPNIIHASAPRSPHWSLSLRFPHQDPIHSPLLTHIYIIIYCFRISSFYSVFTLILFVTFKKPYVNKPINYLFKLL